MSLILSRCTSLRTTLLISWLALLGWVGAACRDDFATSAGSTSLATPEKSDDKVDATAPKEPDNAPDVSPDPTPNLGAPSTANVKKSQSRNEPWWVEGLEWDLLAAFALACVLLGIAYAAVAAVFGAWFKRPLVWSAAFILFGQLFLANLPAKAGIRHATIADPVRRFVFELIQPDPRLARAMWPAERDFDEKLIGEPLLDLSMLVGVALALGMIVYSRSEYDSRERE